MDCVWRESWGEEVTNSRKCLFISLSEGQLYVEAVCLPLEQSLKSMTVPEIEGRPVHEPRGHGVKVSLPSFY